MINEIVIGIKIANLRKQNETTQTALAELLGVSAQAVSKWESGKSLPDIITLDKIAKQFGQDLNYFTVDLEEISTEDIENRLAENDSAKLDQSADYKKSDKRKRMFDMAFANWKDKDFSGLQNVGGRFSCSNIINCNFSGSELANAVLKANVIKNSNFDKTDLKGGKFKAAHLTDSSFVGCDFGNAVFVSTHLGDNDFSKSKFGSTVFKTSVIMKCNFENVNLSGTEFKNCKFKSVKISGEVIDANFVAVVFKDVIFEDCKFENTLFKHIKLNSVQFVNCTADATTYAFLQACDGLDSEGISRV